jgi:hypothetical protein
MSLDDNSIKDTVRTVISNFIYPKQLGYESSIANTVTLYELFYPLSTTISTAKFYVSGSIGTPSPMTIDITSGNKTSVLSNFTITPSIGWNTLTVNKNVISRKEHYLKFYPQDTNNYYYLGASTISTPYKLYKDSELQTNNLSFEISIPTFVYKSYSPNTISVDMFPLVSIDIDSRGNIEHPYIKATTVRHRVVLSATVYSKYSDELDRICYYIEKALYKKKIGYIDNVFVVSAGNISSITQFRDNILQKSKSFTFDMFISETID